jgi:hypothetical protein
MQVGRARILSSCSKHLRLGDQRQIYDMMLAQPDPTPPESPNVTLNLRVNHEALTNLILTYLALYL